MGPGGLHENSKFFNCTGGAASFVDKVIFGKNHIYSRPSCRPGKNFHICIWRFQRSISLK